MTLAGVDGCRGGWFAVLDDGALSGVVAATFADVLALGPDLVAVDIPVGLPEAGPRACDVAARRALAPRRGASVFPAPVRPALAGATHAEASALHRTADGRGMSAQAFGIVPKIVEVDRVLRARPDAAARVAEVHPEVSFAAMAGGAALAWSKKTAEGYAERVALLRPTFGDAPERIVAERPKGLVAADDVLDAFAVLWTARRIAAGTAHALPDGPPPRDAYGLAMAIHV